MNIIKSFLILGLLASSFTAFSAKVDPTRLFIQTDNIERLPKYKLIKSVKYLFDNHYIINTDNAHRLATLLKNNPDVIDIKKNYHSEKSQLPTIEPFVVGVSQTSFKNTTRFFNDPKVDRIWSFESAALNGISVNRSYNFPLSRPKEDIIVAVVDTGVDYNHEDLAEAMWHNPNEIPQNGIDDDQNGYVDDYYGINTLIKDNLGKATGDPMASHSHGTHVAGTIAASQNNYTGVAGIAQRAKIMAIRAVPNNSDETDADVVESFLYAAKHGARLINCSFGKNHNEGGSIVEETIEHIGKKYGVLVLAAAGNDYGRNIDKSKTYPASFTTDYLLVVASTSSSGALSWFSNVGKKSVDLAAPGSSIYSTVKNNRYANMSGTSMATPTTTGVAAELLSHYPEMGPLELKQILLTTVTKDKRFQRKMVSPGRVNLYHALQYTLENLHNN